MTKFFPCRSVFFRFPATHRLLLGSILVFAAAGAWGHGVELFATVEGTAINGKLGWEGGDPIADAPIRAYHPDGTMLAETRTGEDGRFTMPAACRCDHRLVGDAGHGHSATYTVPADELPASLPANPGDAPQQTPAEATAHPAEAAHDHEDHETTPAGMQAHNAAITGDLQATINQAVARQINPLREQLHAYEETIRFRDILGGVGYLFGLAGLVVLVKQRLARPDS